MKTSTQTKRAAGSHRPRVGWKVALWDEPGIWAVWSEGSGRSLWYIQPVDDEARHVLDQVHKGGRRSEVFERTFSYAAEVKTGEMCDPHSKKVGRVRD